MQFWDGLCPPRHERMTLSSQVIDERSTDETPYMLWRMRVRVMQPKGTYGVTYNWNMVRAGFSSNNLDDAQTRQLHDVRYHIAGYAGAP